MNTLRANEYLDCGCLSRGQMARFLRYVHDQEQDFLRKIYRENRCGESAAYRPAETKATPRLIPVR